MLDGFVVVYRAAGLADAELIKGYLESEEIPADLEYESAGPTYGFTMDGLGAGGLRRSGAQRAGRAPGGQRPGRGAGGRGDRRRR